MIIFESSKDDLMRASGAKFQAQPVFVILIEEYSTDGGYLMISRAADGLKGEIAGDGIFPQQAGSTAVDMVEIPFVGCLDRQPMINVS